MFAASLQLTVDYDALIETDSHNDDQQEDKNDYREDDGTTFYRDRPRSRKAADEGKMQGAMTACGTPATSQRDPVRSGYGANRKRNAQAEFFSVWTRSGHSTNAALEAFTTELQAVSGLLGSSGGVIIV
jgi:hypothetical protein